MDFDIILQRIKPKLRAITKKLDGKYTSFDDEDLYQETTLHLWQQCKDKTIENKTDSYILQGCYFYLKNYIRRKFKKIDACSTFLDSGSKGKGREWASIPSAENVNTLFRHIDFNILINDIKDKLSQCQINTIKLYLRGFTTREIGSRLGISHVMVVKIKKKIIQKFRNKILNS